MKTVSSKLIAGFFYIIDAVPTRRGRVLVSGPTSYSMFDSASVLIELFWQMKKGHLVDVHLYHDV